MSEPISYRDTKATGYETVDVTTTYDELLKDFDDDHNVVRPLVLRCQELQHRLAECYRLTGADPDGNEDWRLAKKAVGEVARLRGELDVLQAEFVRINNFLLEHGIEPGDPAQAVTRLSALYYEVADAMNEDLERFNDVPNKYKQAQEGAFVDGWWAAVNHFTKGAELLPGRHTELKLARAKAWQDRQRDVAPETANRQACRQCRQPREAHCDLDEPGVDHPSDCDLMHHEFKAC